MVERTGEGDDGSIGSYWATSDIWLSPPEDEKAPMPELSLSAEIVVGEQNSMQQQKSNGISKPPWFFIFPVITYKSVGRVKK